MQGKIIKGIAGFYYVHTAEGLAECKARGIFRKDRQKPLVGDNVEIEITDSASLTGNIIRIQPRKNALIRPAAANIDQVLLIFAILKPDPNYNLLDRFLIYMAGLELPVVICFNKVDIAEQKEQEELDSAYRKCGCKVLFVSGKEEQGLEEVRRCLQGKTTVAAGPSGVGKSTIINALYPQANMETGEISHKIERGRHTTRYAQLFALSEDTFLMDTPGFTSLNLGEMEKEDLKNFYPEFTEFEARCRFRSCVHINEPVCGVKEALSEGKVSRIRYDNYVMLYEELRNRKKY